MSSLARRCVSEALGTFTLVVLGPGAVMVATKTGAFGHAGVALAFGLAVTIVVSASGHLSGAHINPAVTIGFWTRGLFPRGDVLPYVVSQCVGGIAGSVTLRLVLGVVGAMGATIPILPVGSALLVEAGFTGVLGFVIMGVATDDRTPKAVAPFAIGATVFVGALVTGPLTGGSFNPARTLGPAVVGDVWTGHWLYWVGPIVGMVAGMWLYDLLRPTGAPIKGSHTPIGVEGPIQ